MKHFAVLLLVVVAVCYALPNAKRKYDVEFNKFKQDYNKQYASEEEEARRYEIFAQTYEEVQEHNKQYESGKVSYKKGINKFSDLTKEEHIKQNTGLLTPEV